MFVMTRLSIRSRTAMHSPAMVSIVGLVLAVAIIWPPHVIVYAIIARVNPVAEKKPRLFPKLAQMPGDGPSDSSGRSLATDRYVGRIQADCDRHDAQGRNASAEIPGRSTASLTPDRSRLTPYLLSMAVSPGPIVSGCHRRDPQAPVKWRADVTSR